MAAQRSSSTILSFLPPVLILLLTAADVTRRQNELPERWPIRWGLDGLPKAWAQRGFAGVYWSLLLGAALLAILFFVRTLMAAQREANAAWPSEQRPWDVALHATGSGAYAIAILCSYQALVPFQAPPPFWLILAIVAAHMAITIFLALRRTSRP